MNAATEFDVGPLIWVKSEIDLALERADQCLQKFSAGASIGTPNPAEIKFCRTHLHQVQGALTIVGLDGVTQFTQAIENLLEAIERQVQPVSEDSIVLVQRALVAIGHYLDGLIDGQTNQPLRLLPLYREIQLARGVSSVQAADLFFPDLTIRPPRRGSSQTLTPERFAHLVRQERTHFQRGFLAWLRTPREKSCATEMRNAVGCIEELQNSPSTRAFWWVAGAYLAALAEGSVKDEFANVRQICTRIDLQMRRLAEGSRSVAERLMRDILYGVACADSRDDTVRQVQELYELHVMQESEEILVQAPEEAAQRKLRELVATAEDSWKKYCMGSAQVLPAFNKNTTALAGIAETLDHTDLRRLVQSMLAIGNWLAEDGTRYSEALGMEVATAILLAQSAAENYQRLGKDFAHQVDVTVARIHAYLVGTPPRLGSEVPLLDEISRQAQEKLLTGQVAKEIQSNLAQIEQVLDAFFRNPGKRAELSSLVVPLNQIIGALSIMRHDGAVKALSECAKEIRHFSDAAYVPQNSDFESVADRLSMVGFFVDALQYGAADFDAFVRKMQLPARAPQDAAEPTFTDSLIETQILGGLELPDEEMPQELASTLTEAMLLAEHEEAPSEPGKPESPALAELLELHREAGEPVIDFSLSEKTEEEKPEEAEEEATLIVEAPVMAEIPEPSAETLQLTQASTEEIDAELLSIFLEEATEVLGSIDENRRSLTKQPHDFEALKTIRRSFHTLKGSGRMVGLKDFGDAAWAIEQTLNLWMQREQPVDTPLLGLVDQAHGVFSTWALYLQTRAGRAPDARPMIVLAESLRSGQGDGELAPLPSSTKPAVAAVAATVLPPSAEEPIKAPEAVPSEVLSVELSLEAPASLDEPASEVLIELSELPGEPVEAPLELSIEPPEILSLELSPEAPLEPASEALIAPPAPEVPIKLSELPSESVETLVEVSIEPPETLPEISIEFSAPLPEALSGQPPAVLEVAEEGPATPAVLDLPVYPAETLSPKPEPIEAPPTVVLPAAQESETPLPDHEAPPLEKTSAAISAPAGRGEEAAKESFSMPPELFEIFSEEAKTHLAVLRREFRVLENNPQSPAPFDMYRAAHTLAGISATVGLTSINRLGLALEQALKRRGDSLLPETGESLETIQQAIDTLSSMLNEVIAQNSAATIEEPVEALQALYPATAVAISLEAVEPLETSEMAAEIIVSEVVEGATDTAALVALEKPTVLEIPQLPQAPETLETPLSVPAGEEAHELPLPEPVLAAPKPSTVLPGDEIDEQLLPIFLEEAIELEHGIGIELRAWRNDPINFEAVRTLLRLLHTLKGSARMTGLMSLGAAAHAIETSVQELTQAGKADSESIEKIDDAFDEVRHVIDLLQKNELPSQETLPSPPITAPPAAAALPPATALPSAAAPLAPVEPTAEVVPEPSAILLEKRVEARPEVEDESLLVQPTLRVRAELVDRLVNETGELSITRSRIEGEMRSLKESLLDLTENVIRLRRQLREIELEAELQMQSQTVHAEERNPMFDPLEFDRYTRFQELTRMMAESVNDVATIQQNLFKNLNGADAALTAQARLNREVQQELLSVRMMPFSTLADRLYRILRQTSRDLNKRANLEILGGQVELDRSVLDKIVAPLEHMLRNAIAHGLEENAVRVARGKPSIGEITISLRQESNEILLTFADDGAGLDFNKIRARAVAGGLIKESELNDPARLADLIFASGFSTAQEVSQVAGRGIGMDVVKTEISRLGGRIEISSIPGKGTEFRLSIPLTLAVTRALLVRAGNKAYAIPSVMIEQVLELKEQALAHVRVAGLVEWMGKQYPFNYLPHLLGDMAAVPEPRRRYGLLLLRSGSRRIAAQIDELTGNEEIVVKNIGPQLARVVGLDGATVLGDGRVVLILNPVALSVRAPISLSPAAIPIPALPVETKREEAARSLSTVMVVDDSLTVRKITSRLLEREGYQVVTAKDGVDALEKLLDVIPDVMLVDVEMPRMDGFDLTRNIRGDIRLKNVPVVMITSRTAEKHRSYAFEIGVNRFLGKPYQEEELLEVIGEYVKKRN